MTTTGPRPRILYGSLFCWMSITGGRFLAPFLEHEANLTDSWIGIALGIQYGILSLLAPLYGHIADQREQLYPNHGRGHVLVMGVTLGTVAFCLHGFYRMITILFHTTQATDDGVTTTLTPLVLVHSVPYHLLVQSLYAACFATMFPVLDGMTVDYLQKRYGDSKEYGSERLYGAVSWGVTNLILGPLIDRYGMIIYYPCAIFACLYSLVTIYIFSHGQDQQDQEHQEEHTEEHSHKRRISSEDHDVNGLLLISSPVVVGEDENDENTNKDNKAHRHSTISLVFAVFGSVYGGAFCFCYFVLNTGFSVVENLVFLFFEFLGGSNTICAITVALTVMFEIPMFHIAPTFLRKYEVGWLLLLANAAFWIRVTGYTLIPQGQAWWVFLLEPFHGFTYAGAQASAVEYVNQNVPRGYEASGQGIVNFVRGLASILGLWLGGILQDVFGPRFMYRVFVAAITVGMTVFGTVRCRYSQQERYDPIRNVPTTSSAANEHMDGTA